jgi:hypothetical protein
MSSGRFVRQTPETGKNLAKAISVVSYRSRSKPIRMHSESSVVPDRPVKPTM